MTSPRNWTSGAWRDGRWKHLDVDAAVVVGVVALQQYVETALGPAWA